MKLYNEDCGVKLKDSLEDDIFRSCSCIWISCWI